MKNIKILSNKPNWKEKWRVSLVNGTKNFTKALLISLGIASCGNDYPNNEFNLRYDPNTDKIEGYYNIKFNHSHGSAWYSIDNYNINLSQTDSSYLLKINDDEYKVSSPEEAKNIIYTHISKENEWFVHEEYIKKAENKTADFIEKYNEYANDENRTPEKTIQLNNK